MNSIRAADLFCGAGGFSTGLMQAAVALGFDVDLLAVNHWDLAIATHSANHPHVRHLCESVDSVDPRKVVPGGHLHLLMASPECTHHSNARGGKPMSDQSRATAWHILRWAEALEIDNILIENVREFTDWGPLYPDDYPDERLRLRPIPEKKGAYYRNFLRNLRVLGYTVQDRVLNAAHFGDATTRQRLFIQARKRHRIAWPKPTHLPKDELRAYEGAKPWRPAREIIDWSLEGKSIYGRRKPLSPNTLARIMAGLRKYSGLPFVIGQQSCAAPRTTEKPLPTIAGAGAISLVEPFLVVLRNHCDAASLDAPTPTIAAQGNHLGLCEPFVIPVTHSGGPERAHDINAPLPTITTAKRGELSLIEPYLVNMKGRSNACDIDAPTPTITAHAEHLYLAEPFIVPQFGEREGQSPRTHSLDAPLPAVTSHGAGALVEPFIVGAGGPSGSGRPQSVTEPLGTILGENHRGLVEPYLVKYHGNHAGKQDGDRRVRSVEEPVPTLDASNRLAVAQPFIIRYHGTDTGAHSVDEPLGTITARDRFALVHPEVYSAEHGQVVGYLDIRFRMLQPHELAGAMSFPEGYQFRGNRDDQVKQIGNAVPVRTAAALCRAMIGGAV